MPQTKYYTNGTCDSTTPSTYNPEYHQIANDTRTSRIFRLYEKPNVMLRMRACKAATGTPFPHTASLQYS